VTVAGSVALICGFALEHGTSGYRIAD